MRSVLLVGCATMLGAGACRGADCSVYTETYEQTGVVDRLEDHVTFQFGDPRAKYCGSVCGDSEFIGGCTILSIAEVQGGAGGAAGASDPEVGGGGGVPPGVPTTGPAEIRTECRLRSGYGCE